MSRWRFVNMGVLFSLASIPVVSGLSTETYIPGRILVKTSGKLSISSVSSLAHTADSIGAKNINTFSLVSGLKLYEFDPQQDINQVTRAFMSNPNVEYAEPDYIYRTQAINDPRFGDLWGLENIGQNQGTPDADINAQAMWDIEKGKPNVVIGIIDTGIDYTHQDLVNNLWRNPGEIPNNNIDDDNNNYIDDIYGINAISNTGNPMDDNVHGTHVAGTIGAVGNNSVGVVGVAQVTKLIGCKFLSASGSGSVSDAIKCMEYFADLKSRASNPVNIIATNNSWGGGSRSQSMLTAIERHRDLGILFIAAAGNEESNNDEIDRYPCNYETSNVISVAATDRNDQLADFSNYGKTKVHIAAPGVKIISTVPGQTYSSLSGTSMATPHVSGLAAIISSRYPELDYMGIKNLIISSGQKIPSIADKTITGRRIRGADINGVGALTCRDQILSYRQLPTSSNISITVGQNLLLEAVNINCQNSAGPITLLNNITLEDNGQNGDQKANDGISSLLWKPTTAGEYDLTFPDNDIVHISVTAAKPKTYRLYDNISYEYTHITGTALNATDESLHLVRSPFPILFNGNQTGFTGLYISSNGTISFNTQTQPGPTNQQLPTTLARNLIAPYWDDLWMETTNADIFVDVIGQAPNRKLIIEWWRFTHYRATGVGAFQVVFYENSPDIRFNYLDTNVSHASYNYGLSATVGLQINQTKALEYSFMQPKVTSGKSILFKFE